MSIAVGFIARLQHADWLAALRRFAASYRACPAGIDHRLLVVYKGFAAGSAERAAAAAAFDGIPHHAVEQPDAGFDIGTYRMLALGTVEDRFCALNTKTEILAPGWLRLLSEALDAPGVGLAGNSGSYESHYPQLAAFPPFPNIHIRTNAFLIERAWLARMLEPLAFPDKLAAWMFESGPDGLSRQVLRAGLGLRVVGRDGRAHPPAEWPACGSYRSGRNAHALVADDDWRRFPGLPEAERAEQLRRTWGPYLALDPARRAAAIDPFLAPPVAGDRARIATAALSGARRNGPCPCGSALRFRDCHGRPA